MLIRKVRAAVVLLLVFILTCIAHEAGHYVTAKIFGVRVERFAIGWGPSILSTKLGETEFAIAALPIGAQVRLFNDTLSLTPEQEFTLAAGLLPQLTIEELRQKDPNLAYEVENFRRSLNRHDPFEQAIIILAGPLGNVFLAILVTIVAVFIPRAAEAETRNQQRQRPFNSDEPEEALIDALVLPFLVFRGRVDAVQLTGPYGLIAEGLRMCGGNWRTILVYVSSLNVALAYLNLLPLCPLDGGRLSLLALDVAVGPLTFVRLHNIEAIECWISFFALGFLLVGDFARRSR